ncbi:MAG: DUF2971 domain-containing protein [Nitrosopumilus sp.]
MSLVYKYYNPDRSEFFKKAMLQFTTPDDLNDPVDCIPAIDIIDIDKRIQSVIDRNVNNIRGRLPQKAIDNASHQLRLQITNNKEAFLSTILDIHKRQINDRFGILSLSKKPDIELMWSHYCHDHSGIVIGLDSSSNFFKRRTDDRPDIGVLREVQYKKILPTIYVDDYKVPPDLFYTKKDIWKYEKEVRIIRELKNCDKHINNGGKEIHLWYFPKSDIRCVIFGMRCNDDTINQIINDIKSDKEYNVELKKMDYDNNGMFKMFEYDQ